MSDEYLWDRSVPVDRDVEDLEQLLVRYRARPQLVAPPLARPPVAGSALRRPAWPTTALAAAAVILLALGIAWMGPVAPQTTRSATPGWALVPLTGTPTIGEVPLDRTGHVWPGTWIETDASSTARLDVGEAGRVVIAPGSRVQVTRADAAAQHLHLEEGSLDAMIWAPPGQVVVTTPVATAVDLGCAYTLTLDANGHGRLHVTSGWVGLVHDGREAFVPAGARVGLSRGSGPGTPVLVSATAELAEAVETFDRPPHMDARRAALDAILVHASPGDALTLWHLLTRVEPDDRGRVFDALAARQAPPPHVTRAGVEAGHRAMLDAWWDTLGYGNRDWWRLWLREWREAR